MTLTAPRAVDGAPLLGVSHTPPSFSVPQQACDCHVHVFGPVERFPFASGRLYTPGAALLEDLKVHQGLLHMDRVVIVQPSPYGQDNSCTVAATQALGRRARAVAVVAPDADDGELETLNDAGVRGLRVNLESRGETSLSAARAAMEAAAHTAARFGWHVQTYTNLTVLAGLSDVIRRLPTTLVVDHFGRAGAQEVESRDPRLQKLLDLVSSGKVYVKLSAPHRSARAEDCSDMAMVARTFIDANPDRMLWGSDWPHPGGKPGVDRGAGIEPFRPVDDGQALNRLAQWATGTTLHKILVDNPARLYGF
ncbi:amidohydrolase family protein [Aquabacter sp. CN5-332]|uniref:amidohydrolase family protein n=1 Tax=Aquabacter sp. CN5-332 TaxID=3156608 RepID=UPI0032B51FC3